MIPCTLLDSIRRSVMSNHKNRNSVAKSPQNFGSATFILTRFMKQQTLMYQSTSRTDVYFLFRKKTQKRLRNGTVSMYFECQTCLDANDPFDRSKPCRVTVNNGLIVTDPDVGHSPFCAPLSKVQLERLRLDRETRQKCRSLGMAPSVAYQEMISQIPERATNIVEQALLATNLPSYQSVRKSLYRHVKRGELLSLNNSQIHSLNLPGAGFVSTESVDSFHLETSLFSKICNQQQHPTCSTDSRSDADFYQFYTIYGRPGCEIAPICFALLPKQNQPNFRIIFQKLKEILASFYGNEKHIHPLVTDFGLAAVQAVVSVIQNGLSVVSCTLNLRYTIREWSTSNLVEIVNVLTLFSPHLLLLVWNRFQYDPIRLHLKLPEKIEELITMRQIVERDRERHILHPPVANDEKFKSKRRKITEIPLAYRKRVLSLILETLIGD